MLPKHKHRPIAYGKTITAEDMLAVLPSKLPFCAYSVCVDEVAVEGDIVPSLVGGASPVLYGFCMEHAGVPEIQSGSDLLALQQQLEASTIHRASVCAVWLIVCRSVPNCPQLRAEPYADVAHTSVRPVEATEFCLFCGAAIALARMRNHVAVHLQKGEVVTDPRMRGEAEPCGFCGRTTGTCTTSIVRKKISSTCPCVVPPCANKKTCPVNVLFPGVVPPRGF